MPQPLSHGADVEQLDDIAVALRAQSDRMRDVGGRGSALLEKLKVAWEGPDLERFARQWRVAHRAIDDAENDLRAFGRQLVQEAEDQRATSGGGSTGGGPGAGAWGGGLGPYPGSSWARVTDPSALEALPVAESGVPVRPDLTRHAEVVGPGSAEPQPPTPVWLRLRTLGDLQPDVHRPLH